MSPSLGKKVKYFGLFEISDEGVIMWESFDYPYDQTEKDYVFLKGYDQQEANGHAGIQSKFYFVEVDE